MVKIGTVIAVGNNKATVFTMDSEFVTIYRPGLIVGEQVHFATHELVRSRLKFSKIKGMVLSISVAAAALLFTLGFGFLSKGSNTPPVSAAVVAVDINPSIQLSVDQDFHVLSAQSFNDDGGNMLIEISVDGLPLKEAVNKIVSKAQEMGFLDIGTGVVLVTAALEDTDVSKKGDYRSKLESLLSEMEKSQFADTLSLFIDSEAVKINAEKNRLSIGRELLYEYAEQKKIDISLDDIRSGNVTELLNKLNTLKNELPDDVSIVTGTKINTETDRTTKTKPDTTAPAVSEKTTDSVTTASLHKTSASEKPSIGASTSKTDTPTTKPESFTASMSASVQGSKISIKWASIPDDPVIADGNTYKRFKYYKIVASQSPNPKYPEDGYLAVISNPDTSAWSFDPSSDCYNRNPDLQPDKVYYFSVTYVFENGKLYANDAQLTIPKTSSPSAPPSFTPAMNASIQNNKIVITWESLPSTTVVYGGTKYSGFSYYKIVASTEPEPKYPEDGYLTYESDKCASSWSFDPKSDKYNSPKLISGTTYYFSVTYVFSNGKIYANDVALAIP